MLPSYKYFSSFLSYKLHSLIGGTRIPKQYTPKRKLLRQIPVKNKKLARELEEACQKKGFLTFAEYMHISQFGKHGYYATHRYHGMTDAYLRWTKAIIALCRKEHLTHVVEFGCGDGKLGAEIIKDEPTLSWSGIEVNTQEVKNAQALFTKERLDTTTMHIYRSIEEISLKKPCLLVFSYSLDSIAPELFINTTDSPGHPNAMIGVCIKNGLISECITDIPSTWKNSLSDDHIPPKRKLHPWQRVYVPLQAYIVLRTCIEKLPQGSMVLILDEFTPPPFPWQTDDLCLPRDLEKFALQRAIKNMTDIYKATGENLLYFPGFLAEYIKLLKNLGLKNISFDSDHAGAEKILQKKALDNPKDIRFCCCLLAGKCIDFS